MAIHVFHSQEPVYLQISEALLEEIRSTYIPGEYLPSEHALAERFGVNRHTLRRAIDELIQDGIVERHHGRGTVILHNPIEYPIHAKSRFTTSVATIGQTSSSTMLKKEKMLARGGIAKHLQIEEGSPVLWLEMIRYINQRPIGLSSQFLPEPYASQVESGYTSGSLHAFLEAEFNLEIHRSTNLITAVLPQDGDARRLNMSKRLPLLRVKLVNLDRITGKPVEYAVVRSRADSIELRIDF